MRVVMIGTGYVGLVSGTCLAEVGHTVTCVDLDEEKVNCLKDGISPIYEPGIEQLILRNIEHERLFFTTELSDAIRGADMVFIAVGTPEGEDGCADLNYVRAAANSLGDLIDKDMLVVVKSTVPVGTCDEVNNIIFERLKQRNMKVKVSVASNPEFLKEGNAIDDFLKPDRIVIGVSDSWAEKVLRRLYHPFVVVDPGRLHVMKVRSSELTKYASNSMLATRISFMNELSHLCEQVDASIDDVRRGMGADPRIGRSFLYAGPGYGGSCFPKDVHALLQTAQQYNIGLDILRSVRLVNKNQKNWVSQKIKNHFSDLKSKRLAVWGLTFKPGTDDVRESPAKTIIENILNWGGSVIAHDPEGMKTFQRCFGDRLGISYVDRAYDALEGVDGLVLVTEWMEYKQPNWDKVKSLMRGNAIFDFRNQYAAFDIEEKGLVRIGIGQ